jgi:hypothetical protein
MPHPLWKIIPRTNFERDLSCYTSKERQFDPEIIPGVYCAVLWRFGVFFGARKTFETQRTAHVVGKDFHDGALAGKISELAGERAACHQVMAWPAIAHCEQGIAHVPTVLGRYLADAAPRVWLPRKQSL